MARAEKAIASLLTSRIGGECWHVDGESGAAKLPKSDFLLISGHNLQAGPAPEMLWNKIIVALETAHKGLPVVVVLPSDDRKWTFARRDARARGWIVPNENLNPWVLLDCAQQVFTLGDEIGFLALLRGRPVRCFAQAFYAGWGLTMDDANITPALFQRNIREIFAAECLLATHYFDPFKSSVASFEETASLLAEWRHVNAQNRRIAACVGMSFWKRRTISAFLRSTDGSPRFVRGTKHAIGRAKRSGGAIAVWNSRVPASLPDKAAAAGVDLVRIEDGFVRSVGLGADFMPAASIVADRSGIYYDTARANDLAEILESSKITKQEIVRAGALIHALVRRGITKYNIGGTFAPLPFPPGRRRIFVPGQVEDDRSVQLGGRGMGNLELLRRVRADNKDVFIVFKPHPDVEAGYRSGAISETDARKYADCIVHGVSSAAIIAVVDEVHTLTSLTGFEALLRGRRVVTYGAPFYAGWGLTTDLVAHARKRVLSVEELVAGTLIRYPRYLDPVTNLFCTPELILDRLEDASLWRAGPLVRLRRIQGALAKKLRAMPLFRPLVWKPR